MVISQSREYYPAYWVTLFNFNNRRRTPYLANKRGPSAWVSVSDRVTYRLPMRCGLGSIGLWYGNNP